MRRKGDIHHPGMGRITPRCAPWIKNVPLDLTIHQQGIIENDVHPTNASCSSDMTGRSSIGLAGEINHLIPSPSGRGPG